MTISKLKPEKMIEYPFPLREGQQIYIKLPENLSLKEVKIISNFLETLVIDDDH